MSNQELIVTESLVELHRKAEVVPGINIADLGGGEQFGAKSAVGVSDVAVCHSFYLAEPPVIDASVPITAGHTLPRYVEMHKVCFSLDEVATPTKEIVELWIEFLLYPSRHLSELFIDRNGRRVVEVGYRNSIFVKYEHVNSVAGWVVCCSRTACGNA